MRHVQTTATMAVFCALARVSAADNVEITVVTGASLLSASLDKINPSSSRGPSPSTGLFFPTQTDHHTLGGGFLLGARVGYRVGRKTVVDAGLAVSPAASLRTTFSFSCPAGENCYRERRTALESRAGTYWYDVGFVEELWGTSVRPFLTAGIGGVSYSLSRADEPTDRGSTSLAFSVGAGVRMDLGPTGVRLELADRIVHDHFVSSKTEHDPQLRLGLFFRVR